jgi:hypothetical protein
MASEWQIIKDLYKGFGNNPRNAETFEAIANMNPIFSAYRGAKTLANVDVSPMRQSLLNEAYGISDPNVNRQAANQVKDTLFGLLDVAPTFPVAKAGAKGLLKVTENLPAGMSIKDVGKKLTPFEEAFNLAQQRAALPVSEGGLGLPATNTAMDRAKAMGFDVKNIEYHTTDVNKIPSLYEHGFMNMDRGARDLKHLGSEYGGNRYYATGQGNYTSDNPMASWFTAQGKTGADQAMLPLLINKSKSFDYTNPEHIKDLMTPRENYVEVLGKAEMNPKDLKALQEGKHYLMEDWITLMNLKKRGYTGTNLIEPPQYYGGEGVTTNTFNPSNIRSVNAAFDPFRRNEADILAGVAAAPAGLLAIDKEKPKKKRSNK